MSCANCKNHGIWKHPVVVERTNFKFKSLCDFVVNPTVGCSHGCLFCFVPSVAVMKQKSALSKLGIARPDVDWGNYVFVREWDEDKFRKSLEAAERTPDDKLKPEGHRAVMLSSTCDPYQVLSGTDNGEELYRQNLETIQKVLELIRDESTLRVRILTRSPLAKGHFELYRSFGDRLLFGMSLPTLNDKLARAYEPNAPGVAKRLETLQAAKEAGLNVYVAIAPTYPECDEEDLRKTLSAVAELDPVTIFHEPINVRGNNVERIRQEGARLGQEITGDAFADAESWQQYAIDQMMMVEWLAKEIGVFEKLHFWPDTALASQDALARMEDPTAFVDWLMECWTHISEWPGED